jgi:endoribonuclease LACTB2
MPSLRRLPSLTLGRCELLPRRYTSIAYRASSRGPGIRMATQLVDLPEIERLSPACIRILGGNPSKFTLQGTNTYLLGTGPSRLLIDTGEGKPSWIAAVKRTLQEEGVTVQTALITHWHPDHVNGIPQLLEYSPQTTVHKKEPNAGQLDITDGQTFHVQGATLRAVHTPGHTTDHMSFVLEEEDALFTGDNVLGHGTAVFEDLATYLKSLARMEGLVAGRGYPGHGAVLPEVRATITEYIKHRAQREAQVVETLDAPQFTTDGRGATSMELVRIIYSNVHESLHLPAQGGVLQVLHKLRLEDKVVQLDKDQWRLRDRSSL